MRKKSRNAPGLFSRPWSVIFSPECNTFEEFRDKIIHLEKEADVIKRRVRGHIPKETMMPISNFLLFRYLREQDGVLDAVEDSPDWIS